MLHEPQPVPTHDDPYLHHLNTACNIATTAMLFGEVARATQHPDGRAELDTTHALMLALVVYELAPLAGVDPLEAMADALVHDLPEPFSALGDVNTAWGLSSAERAAKRAAELIAVARLDELLPGSRIVHRLRRYETQTTASARFVRVLDKVLPKLTHLLNHGQALRVIGMSQTDMIRKHAEQCAELTAQYPEQTFALTLLAAACRQCELELNLDAPLCSTCNRPGHGHGPDGHLCQLCAMGAL